MLEAFGEIPAPGKDVRGRQQWLKELMRGKWRDVDAAFDHVSWRRAILEGMAALQGDSVVYTHFVALNVVVGAARGVDDVVSFRPDYASITCVASSNGSLRILELGREAQTDVRAGR